MKDLSIPQIAEKLDISDNTVRRYVKRFKDHLPPPVKAGIVFKYPESIVELIGKIYAWYEIGLSKMEILNSLQLMSCDKKQEDEWKEIEEMEDCDFRVGDPVTVVGNGKVIETTISSVSDKTFKECPVVVFIDRPYSNTRSHFTIFGDKPTEEGRLYHGHNLKITVEEKKPVRTVERWLMAYLTPRHRNNRMTLNLTEQEAISEAAKYQDDDFIILAGPIKVKIPV